MRPMLRLLIAIGLGLESLAAWSPGHAAEPSGDPPRFEVSAIVIQDNGVAWALMAEPRWTQGTTRLVAAGAMIGPYRLVEVAADHVVMQGPSGPPFKVLFSWRGAGTGAASTEPAVQGPELGSGRRANVGDKDNDEARRSARRERKRATDRGGPLAEEPATPGGTPTAPSPSLRELSHGLPPQAQAQLEEFIRLREQMLQEELAKQRK
ncbi:MAG: hypothetical protein ACRDH5_02185 [bacterium]